MLLAPLARAAVTGSLIDEQGAPISGATIQAFPPESTTELSARLRTEKPERTPLATAQSDAKGAFRIDVARTPVVTLAVTAPGRPVITLDAADGEDLGALLLRKATLRKGRILMSGQPLVNAVIGGRSGAVVRSDAKGAFEIAEPSAGDRILVFHPDSGFDDVPFRNPVLDLRVEPGITVKGRVVGDDGKPVAQAALEVMGRPQGVSAEDGTFALEHVNPSWPAILARAGDRVGVVLRSAKQPYEIRVGNGARLSGTVRDGKTQAVVGGMRLTLAGEAAVQSALSDAKGNFTFPPMPATQYRLGGSHPAYLLFGPPIDLHGGKSETRALAATPLSRVSGTVADENRKPVPAASLTVAARFLGMAGSMGRAATTNAAGEFTLRIAAGGPPITLEASKDGYATASTSMTLGEGETKSGVAFRLVRGTALRLAVVDAEKTPVPEIAVQFFRTTGDGPNDQQPVTVCDRPGCTVTGADGVLQVQLAPGRYELRLTGETIAMKTESDVNIGAKPQQLTVTVERGADVSGRVVYADGSPVPDVSIRTSTTSGPPARSDANGVFTLHGLKKGPVTLVTETPGRFGAPPKQVTAPASDVVITMPKPGRLAGRVVDAQSQQPIADFGVGVTRRGGMPFGAPPTPFHAEDGSFTLDVPPGSVDLSVTATGYVRGSATGIDVEEGKSANGIEVKLERGARLTGRVTSGGAPVSGAFVRVQEMGMVIIDRTSLQTATDANGEYVLDSLAPGERMITFNKEGFAAQRKSVEVSASKDARLDVELARGREVHGRVVNESGQPVADADVRPQISGSGPIRSDSEGNFRIGNLSDQPITIVVMKSGYMEARVENVDPGSNINVTLQRGGTITGRVLGLTAEELQQTMITVYVPGASYGGRAGARPDANGNFVLQGVPDGRVNVAAMVRATPTRQSGAKFVDVVNGSAPPIEITFGGGYTVRGNLTRGGAPLTGAYLFFQPADPQKQTPVNADVREGVYEASGLSAGAYKIIVRQFTGASILREDYTVGGDARHDIDIRASSIRGKVLDANSSAPLADTIIVIDAGGARATTDSAGNFVLDVEGDGAYTVRAQRQRYQSASRDVTVANGQTAPVELRLESADAATVRVMDVTTGRPVEAYVGVTDGAHKQVYTAQGSSDDGVARIYVAPGTYSLIVRVNGYAPENATLVVPGPEVRVLVMRGGTVVLQSKSAAHVRGGLTRAGGLPIPIFDRAVNVPPGSYTLEVVGESGKGSTKYPVTVIDGQTTIVPVD